MCLAYSSVPVSAVVVTKREQPVELMLGVRDGAVDGDLPVPGEHAGPVEGLPDIELEDGLLAGAALLAMVSSNRRSIGSRFPRHPHYLAVAIFPEVRQFPISRLKRRRLRRQYPPGPLRGRERRPYAGARSAAQTGLLASYATPGNASTGYRIARF